ncbi:hypothetical protein C2E21_2500 [Chlorella sorokiniana]|jgi:hypothetical protein|uniref:Uncharacterized protein n=1 Tax=Chlorella sorokiniana TaxID=3076 RepID=A0A2P6TYC6_CHLSO|nr:hypothetical protein C2E21_2500 [Chlorella sorokiniana]|eukprot:PRW59074.1 hypothetical protein C2E21_2500 [Chlorella sorokiniana]
MAPSAEILAIHRLFHPSEPLVPRHHLVQPPEPVRQLHLASLLPPATVQALRQQQHAASARRHARRRALAGPPKYAPANVQQQLRWQQRPIGSGAPAA